MLVYRRKKKRKRDYFLKRKSLRSRKLVWKRMCRSKHESLSAANRWDSSIGRAWTVPILQFFYFGDASGVLILI